MKIDITESIIAAQQDHSREKINIAWVECKPSSKNSTRHHTILSPMSSTRIPAKYKSHDFAQVTVVDRSIVAAATATSQPLPSSNTTL